MRLFASERSVDEEEAGRLPVRLSGLRVRQPRRWGGCRLADNLWKQLGLDGFSRERPGRTWKGIDWKKSCKD
ncbi:MAG: hypothetical protein LBI02_11030 [Opitutaceae bacterium]|nr:hypothetical protein [Opitutaceae bacterium]